MSFGTVSAPQDVVERRPGRGADRRRERPGVAGVIGRRKFTDDLWGDTVNLASRLESGGEPGKIQVSESTFAQLRERYAFDEPRTVELKGKGPTPAWFLLRRVSDDVGAVADGVRSIPFVRLPSMNVARDAVLWAADNRWLREHLPRYRFVRRSVRRFMPGETLDDALAAATRLRERGLPTMFTALGENVTVPADARRVVDAYRDAYDRVADVGLDTEFSVKPTHLGLDLDPQAALANLEELATKAAERDNWLWLDMESAAYVEGTLELYRKLRAGHPNVGVCLQAYLKRTADDVDSLMPLDPTIRLVKGAYREPRELVFGSREVIDEAYRRLALLIVARKGPVGRLALGTHDVGLVRQIEADVGGHEGFEVHMLFGIRQADLLRMASEGHTARSLISYGTHWYPWFMRRIAEKPVENTLLALRNLVARA